jgi:hypothetical protein
MIPSKALQSESHSYTMETMSEGRAEKSVREFFVYLLDRNMAAALAVHLVADNYVTPKHARTKA